MDKFSKKLEQDIPHPFHLPNPDQNFQQVLENRPMQNQSTHVPESPRSNAEQHVSGKASNTCTATQDWNKHTGWLPEL